MLDIYNFKLFKCFGFLSKKSFWGGLVARKDGITLSDKLFQARLCFYAGKEFALFFVALKW